MGDGSRAEDFHRENEFMSFLDFVEQEADELVIVGDLLELWQADLDKVLFRHSAILTRLLSLRGRIKITYVIGNHDYIPFIRYTDTGMGIALEYNDPELNLIAEHGHAYDIFNRYKNPLRSVKWPKGKHFTLLLMCLEKYFHTNADNWLKKALENLDEFSKEVVSIRNKIPPASQEYLKKGGHFGEFEEAVQNHFQNGKKIVIFGHTHRCQLEKTVKGIYANCGSWVDIIDPTYITVDNDTIELREALTHHTMKSLKI